jgi:hypothetical protein
MCRGFDSRTCTSLEYERSLLFRNRSFEAILELRVHRAVLTVWIAPRDAMYD